jgi:hypothetical protein
VVPTGSPTEPDLSFGLIIIRLWRPDEAAGSLRASLTIKLDVVAEATEHAAASSVDALCSQVRAAAEAFVRQGP